MHTICMKYGINWILIFGWIKILMEYEAHDKRESSEYAYCGRKVQTQQGHGGLRQSESDWSIGGN